MRLQNKQIEPVDQVREAPTHLDVPAPETRMPCQILSKVQYILYKQKL